MAQKTVTRADLPTGKRLVAPAPGVPAKSNSLPMALAASPDGRYVVQLNAGYGTFESHYQQSLAVYDTQTGKLTDFPEPRTRPLAPQTLYQGLAFSSDGSHIYVSFESLSRPEGGTPAATGNAIGVYSFKDGAITAERLIPVPLQRLAPGRTQNNVGLLTPPGMAIPAPAGLAIVRTKAGGGGEGDKLRGGG